VAGALEHPRRIEAGGGPLGAHHRPDDLILQSVIPTDDLVDGAGRHDGDIGVADDVPECRVVIGMRVGQDDGGERRGCVLNCLSDERGIRDSQHAIHQHEPLRAVHQEGVHRHHSAFDAVDSVRHCDWLLVIMLLAMGRRWLHV
jgi:hypothetical protein